MSSLYYKDTRVAASSALAKALEAKNEELAAKLYKESNAEFLRHNKSWKPYPAVKVDETTEEATKAVS